MKNKKIQIILSLITFAIVLGGFAVFTKITQSYIYNDLVDQALKDNRVIGETILKIVKGSQKGQPDSVLFAALDDACNTVKLPNKGYICVANKSGDLIASPGQNDIVKGVFKPDYFADRRAGGQQVSFEEMASQDGVFEGFYGPKEMGEVMDVIVTLPFPNNFRLFVHQNNAEIMAQSHRHGKTIFGIGVVLAALFGGLAYAAVNGIVNRFEGEIQKKNNELYAKNKALDASYQKVEASYQESEKLLLNILPKETAEELKAKGQADVRHYENVSVLFTDFKGFTGIAEKISPEELILNLNECFTAFDRICQKHGLEKIKTIGDAYMCAGGLPSPCLVNAEKTVAAAWDMAEFIKNWGEAKKAGGEEAWGVRIGVHSGPVISGIVGEIKFAYDIWGDTVNMASRMESAGEPGRVNISESTYRQVQNTFRCTFRGEVEAKGKGMTKMYFVEGRINEAVN